MTNKLYKLMNWPQIEEIIYSECDNPHALLGPHKAGSQILIQAYFPGAKSVEIKWNGVGAGASADAFWKKNLAMELADEDGYFAALVPAKKLPAYSYLATGEDDVQKEWGEPYRHAPVITEEDTEKFKNGIHYTVYEKLGAHPMELDGLGLMLGIRLKSKKAGEVCGQCLENGLLILTAKEKLRLLPPLNITYDEIDRGLEILGRVLE